MDIGWYVHCVGHAKITKNENTDEMFSKMRNESTKNVYIVSKEIIRKNKIKTKVHTIAVCMCVDTYIYTYVAVPYIKMKTILAMMGVSRTHDWNELR